MEILTRPDSFQYGPALSSNRPHPLSKPLGSDPGLLPRRGPPTLNPTQLLDSTHFLAPPKVQPLTPDSGPAQNLDPWLPSKHTQLSDLVGPAI